MFLVLGSRHARVVGCCFRVGFATRKSCPGGGGRLGLWDALTMHGQTSAQPAALNHECCARLQGCAGIGSSGARGHSGRDCAGGGAGRQCMALAPAALAVLWPCCLGSRSPAGCAARPPAGQQAKGLTSTPPPSPPLPLAADRGQPGRGHAERLPAGGPTVRSGPASAAGQVRERESARRLTASMLAQCLPEPLPGSRGTTHHLGTDVNIPTPSCSCAWVRGGDACDMLCSCAAPCRRASGWCPGSDRVCVCCRSATATTSRSLRSSTWTK